MFGCLWVDGEYGNLELSSEEMKEGTMPESHILYINVKAYAKSMCGLWKCYRNDLWIEVQF